MKHQWVLKAGEQDIVMEQRMGKPYWLVRHISSRGQESDTEKKMDKKVSGPRQAHLDYSSMCHNVVMFIQFCFPLCMKRIYTWMFDLLTRY